jgi:hypothetical protein
MSTADVVARETAWLQAAGDSLPALLTANSGPWQVVQAYWPRTPHANQRGIYVVRARLLDPRVSSQRIRPRYQLTLKCVWPVVATSAGLLESEQQNLDSALDPLMQRIRGPVGDKSHGGRFLSAGENPRTVDVPFEDPERTMAAAKRLLATVVYFIDDFEISG